MNRKLLAVAIASATLSVASVSQAEITMNGFTTIGGGQVLTDDKSANGYDNNLRFDTGSTVGLQFSSDLGDGLNATAQFISRGSESWAVEAEWAYISYEASDSVKIVAGKQRSPFYMYSDYVDVGYAYHWVTPPDGVYSLPFDSTNAIGIVSNNYFGDLDSTFQLLYGRNTKEIRFGGEDVNLDSYNTFTLNWTGTYEFATFRVGFSKGLLNIPIAALDELTDPWEDIGATVYGLTYKGATDQGADVPTATAAATAAQAAVAGVDGSKVSEGIKINEDDVTFAGIGLTLDFDDYFFVGEITQLDLGDSLIGVNLASYVGAGYRYNDFTFHATYGMNKDTTNETVTDHIDQATIDSVAALSGLVDATNDTLEDYNAETHYITVGTRWDFHPSSALKLDITQNVDDLADEDAENILYRLALTTVF